MATSYGGSNMTKTKYTWGDTRKLDSPSDSEIFLFDQWIKIEGGYVKIPLEKVGNLSTLKNTIEKFEKSYSPSFLV